MELPQIMATVLERSLNARLAMDPGSEQLLAMLEDRVIAINIESLEGSFYLLPQRDRLSIVVDHDQNPDIIIEGGLFAYARAATASVLGSPNPEQLLEIKKAEKDYSKALGLMKNRKIKNATFLFELFFVVFVD